MRPNFLSLHRRRWFIPGTDEDDFWLPSAQRKWLVIAAAGFLVALLAACAVDYIFTHHDNLYSVVGYDHHRRFAVATMVHALIAFPFLVVLAWTSVYTYLPKIGTESNKAHLQSIPNLKSGVLPGYMKKAFRTYRVVSLIAVVPQVLFLLWSTISVNFYYLSKRITGGLLGMIAALPHRTPDPALVSSLSIFSAIALPFFAAWFWLRRYRSNSSRWWVYPLVAVLVMSQFLPVPETKVWWEWIPESWKYFYIELESEWYWQYQMYVVNPGPYVFSLYFGSATLFVWLLYRWERRQLLRLE